MKDRVIFSGNSNHKKAYACGGATNEIIPNGLIAKAEIKIEDKEKQCKYCKDLTLIELPVRSNCDLLMERFQTLIANDGEGGKEIVISHEGKAFGIQINYCRMCGRKLR